MGAWPLIIRDGPASLAEQALSRTIRTGVRLSGAGDQGAGMVGGTARCRCRAALPGAGGRGRGVFCGGLVAALSGAPGAGSAWALAEGLESGAAAGWDVSGASGAGVRGAGAVGGVVDVRAAGGDGAVGAGLAGAPADQQRPADDPTSPTGPDPCPTGRRRAGRPSARGWDGAVPSDPVARAAMVDRLEGFAAGYERRRFGVFGFPGRPGSGRRAWPSAGGQ